MVAEHGFDGAESVVKSVLPSFREYLLAGVKATEATVAFDATGGGDPASEDEASVKAFAEELEDFADAAQVLGSET